MLAAPSPLASFEARHHVTLDAVVRYAGASGDFTAIHWDAELAQRAGYDELFAMGMLTAGWLSALLVESFGPGSVRTFGVRFRSRAWLGREVRCTASVDGADDTTGELTIALVAEDDTGQVLIDGSATVLPTVNVLIGQPALD